MHVEFRYSDKTHDHGKQITHINLEEQLSLDHSRSNQGFDDIGLYKRLLSKEGVVKVELAGVKVRHNGHFCQGLASTYRITYADGRTEMYNDKGNFQAHGWYVYHGSSRKITDELELADGEFICGLYLKQGEIVDGITFVTNRRQVHIGGRGGSFIDMTYSTENQNRRIIAFAGQFHGVLSRIGYYSVKIGWEAVREYVMLRWLLENYRAEEKTSLGKRDSSRRLLRVRKDPVCIRWVVNPDTPKEVMHQILRYLF
ncbi:predicted protein [Chaetoceros tenuissimus]|uniref:Jacalin-type lectin domain-containing protein n=1 Tax=Chaetoceros tenuissimus TaxID=426638 RepID=A0AAD3CJT6_9STRA|nr:predicted protein [Chaetoceros tenuissimus]